MKSYGLKAQKLIAQGNALGFYVIAIKRPERAKALYTTTITLLLFQGVPINITVPTFLIFVELDFQLDLRQIWFLNDQKPYSIVRNLENPVMSNTFLICGFTPVSFIELFCAVSIF